MSKQEKVLGILSYFGFLLIVPLLYARKSQYVAYHSKQGVVLALLWILVLYIWQIPLIGPVAGLALLLFSITLFLTGISYASKGIEQPLPVLGKPLQKILF